MCKLGDGCQPPHRHRRVVDPLPPQLAACPPYGLPALRFAVCLCGEALDVALLLPDNFRADGATRDGASRRRDGCRARIRRDGDCPLLDPTTQNEAQLRLHSSTILQGQGRPAELPRRTRGSGGRALAKPRFLEGASTSVAARSIRWVVMQPGGADIAARSSSSMPLRWTTWRFWKRRAARVSGR